ncbi:hypothetical protein [Streptomyces sp. NBC_01235]|uniref:hypothetical protein n=1 Tax=Streptomyces sp. NBC_01235 TaxID=2903788 RepID=UPI002E100CE2|nr:hypothetical protein OG289_00880 [Streptomyces sp. NBC_01235]
MPASSGVHVPWLTAYDVWICRGRPPQVGAGLGYLEVMNLEAVLGQAPDLTRDANVLTVDVARTYRARAGSYRFNA